MSAGQGVTTGVGPWGVSFGVYVHIPFCAQRCDYCDFATWTDRAHLIEEYVAACVADLERRVSCGTVPEATSVFFGGGTPSLLDPDALLRILDAIPRASDAEVTVECNPDSVDVAKLAAYARGGVNRCSFGVQSMVPRVLHDLGRTHDPANVERSVAWARDAGIRRLNLDLIYGTPGESLEEWRATLDAALALGPDHVSAYALTVEPGTPLGRAVAAGVRAAPDDDAQADAYVLADEVLGAAGLHWYEISSWAEPGSECRHNLGYWDGSEYLAIGCAAHGYAGGRRWWNLRTPERYVEAIRRGCSPEAGAERLEGPADREEALVLALRTASGIQVEPELAAVGGELVEEGLLSARDGRWVLTRRGRLLASEVTARLALGRLEC